MKFADFIVPEAIIPELKAEDRDGVVEEMVQALVDAGAIPKDARDSVVKAVIRREELGSTAIGRQIAVPHTKHPSVERPVGTIARSSAGVDFNALDGEKVHLFVLVVSPPDRPGDHLRALESITRRMRDTTFCRFLMQARSVEEIKQLLDEADEDKFGVM